MLEQDVFLVEARIETVVLETWVAAGWLVPQRQEHRARFTEADLARARLILDLKHDLGVNDEGVGVILDLLDQMHGLRSTLRDLSRSLQMGSPDTRQNILGALRRGVTRPDE